MRFSLKKLTSNGHAHLIVPVAVLLLVGAIGSYVAIRSQSHAATVTPAFCQANGMVYQNGRCIPTVNNYSYAYYGAKQGTSNYACAKSGRVYAKFVVSSTNSTYKYLVLQTFNNGSYVHTAYRSNTARGTFYLNVPIPVVGTGYNPAYTVAAFGASSVSYGADTSSTFSTYTNKMRTCY